MLCESAQRYRALMVILQSHRTQNMILRCYPTVSATLETYQILSPVLFQQSLYFPFLIHRICYLLVSTLLEESIQAGALLRPKNGYFQARVAHPRPHVGRAQALFLSCTVQSAKRVATACLNFLCLLPMVLKTRGFSVPALHLCVAAT